MDLFHKDESNLTLQELIRGSSSPSSRKQSKRLSRPVQDKKYVEESLESQIDIAEFVMCEGLRKSQGSSPNLRNIEDENHTVRFDHNTPLKMHEATLVEL